MIENIGLEWTLRVIGILTGIANTLTATFIRNRNAIVRPPSSLLTPSSFADLM